MTQLGVGVIKANSSQAKGKVERLFKTLQDRLVKELRLNKIYTVAKANEFLEKTFIPLEETQSVAIFKKDVVIVEERFDGTIKFKLRGKYLNYKQLPERPLKVSGKATSWVLAKPVQTVPAANHPWRKY